MTYASPPAPLMHPEGSSLNLPGEMVTSRDQVREILGTHFPAVPASALDRCAELTEVLVMAAGASGEVVVIHERDGMDVSVWVADWRIGEHIERACRHTLARGGGRWSSGPCPEWIGGWSVRVPVTAAGLAAEGRGRQPRGWRNIIGRVGVRGRAAELAEVAR